MFFIKPNPSTRAVDILGMEGPAPKRPPIFLPNNKILYSWEEKYENGTKVASYLYNTSGVRICRIKHPVEITTTFPRISREELRDLDVIQASRNKEYFLLRKITKKNYFVGVTKLSTQLGEVKFEDMKKLSDVGNKEEFHNSLFYVTDKGKLLRLSYSFSPNVPKGEYHGRLTKE